MNLPEQPPTFRPPSAAERPWAWSPHDRSGSVPTLPPELAQARFLSQSDAETWLGEHWQQLRDAGVAEVTLTEGDRTVYGPMSLLA